MPSEAKPSAAGALLGLEAEDWVRDLIRLFAAALRDLNDGKPIPAAWRAELDRALVKNRRGAPKHAEVTARQKDIARRVLRARRSGERKGVTREVDVLASKYGVDIRAIYRDSRLGFSAAAAEEIRERLEAKDAERMKRKKVRAQRIRARVNAGESLDSILKDASFLDHKAIRDHQTKGLPLEGASAAPSIASYEDRHKAITAWILDGMHRIVDSEPVDAINAYRGATLLSAENPPPATGMQKRSRRK